MNATTRSPWGFRGRLALSIAGTFVLLGIVLVGIQFLILFQSFQSVITFGTNGAAVDTSGTVGDCATAPSDLTCGNGGATDPMLNYGQALAEDVMGRYLGWSVALLAAFAILAALLAWMLTRSPARKIAGISALAGDISEHDLSHRLDLQGPRDEITDLGDQIDTMLGRLEEAFASQERFIANASHELRTPITATRAALEAPLTQGRVPEELEPYMRRALRANQRMEELITALLLLARARRLGAGDVIDVDLGLLVSETLEALADQICARRIAVKIEVPHGAAIVRGHRASLVIAVQNLLNNAVQHNHDDGSMSIAVASDGKHATLTIENTGPAYTADEADELRQPFNRGVSTRKSGTPGTGLGLSIVESIANAHEGALLVVPGSRSGLTVSLAIPQL
ncbi:sensor histidine kinase [Microbacterium sp. NPDC077663]|uniref:sensor histidine kinase n=1 Tax=Microbacterium sp. NPDC077663 TaxID=3364189 RepID=UPI0037C6D920